MVDSDTHGLLPGVVRCEGDLILHAGDVGGRHVLDALAAIAPLVAIRGNVDGGAWAAGLPERETADAAGVRIYMLHDVKELGSGRPDGIRVVLSGHSHKPSAAERNGILYVNPGSAGPKRFSQPVTIARLHVNAPDLSWEFVEIVP